MKVEGPLKVDRKHLREGVDRENAVREIFAFALSAFVVIQSFLTNRLLNLNFEKDSDRFTLLQ